MTLTLDMQQVKPISSSRNGYTHLHRAGTLKDAIDQCRALSSDGWNVLLSPACASFDMFSDYESRGRIFKELVRELK